MMRKLLFLFLTIIPLIAFSQKAKIEFEKTSHDFGTISENGGAAVYDFVFKNTGDAPLILNNVRASCGCTTPSWSRQPIAPGETGSIKVSYDPRHRPGRFNKSVTIHSNASNAVTSVTINGTVTSKPADPYAAFRYTVGTLKITSDQLNLGSINNTAIVKKDIDIINSGEQPVNVNVNVNSNANYLTATVIPATLKKGEKGKISIEYNADAKKDWGIVSDKINVSVSPEAKGEISIVANIKEDFSKINPEEAPVATFAEKSAELGILDKNATKKHEFYIQNDGKSDLIIRKIKTSDNTVTAIPARTVIKPGKKAKVNVTLKTDDQPGKKVKIISFTLNDPKNTIVSYKLSGEIQ
ncbi:DUF1573 domain-containing protein [Odoribacter lunatus]|uniref:DUF1573 domain-containing protein n=1 Tax=Odoribacter lunatus TaxID=2941335 RepID=UPI002041942A|nr:DUF1573 domain-containing protein [Odoribacter lunatus]